MMHRVLLAALLFPVIPCAAQRPTPATGGGTERPARAARATGSPEALAVAERVVAFAGGAEALAGVHNLVFTIRSGETERRLYWDRDLQRVRVESLSMPRNTFGPVPFGVKVHDIRTGEDLLESPAPPKQAPKVSGRAYWFDDAWWLLVPLQVLDPDVTLSIDAPEAGDAQPIRRLRLHYGGRIGHTKQDWVLHVEEDTGRIVRFDQHISPRLPPRSWRFAEWVRTGPLKLSLVREQIVDGDSRRRLMDVRFVDVAVDVAPPKDVWTEKEKILAGVGVAPPAEGSKRK